MMTPNLGSPVRVRPYKIREGRKDGEGLLFSPKISFGGIFYDVRLEFGIRNASLGVVEGGGEKIPHAKNQLIFLFSPSFIITHRFLRLYSSTTNNEQLQKPGRIVHRPV